MKKIYFFPLLIILSLFFAPIQISHAALVPIQKTTQKASKRLQKRKLKRTKRAYKRRWNATQKKNAPKPEQQNDYGGIWAILITLIVLYFGTGITLMIVGFALMVPGLWIAGIVVVALPFVVLLVAIIAAAIREAKDIRAKRKSLKKEQ